MTLTCETKSETVLVVDDNLCICGFIKVFLEEAGYAVIEAGDGEEALRLYEQHQSSIGLLLTDVVMPNINGLELADRILQIDSQLPILLMSGRCTGIVFPGLECISKPFRPTELVERVSRALNLATRSKTERASKE